jgi:hypothetical protein
MITTFDKLKDGDEFRYKGQSYVKDFMPDNSDVNARYLTGEHRGWFTTFFDDDIVDYIPEPEFKDKYGRKLYIGNRILIALEGDKEGRLVEKIIDNIKLSTDYVSSKEVSTRYDITFNNHTNYAIHYSNIVRIDSNWGI